MSDLDDLVERFAACTLPKAEWTHEAHLSVGAWHVDRYGPAEAMRRLREGIRRLNDSHGTANTASSGYHETITQAYVHLIADYLSACPDALSLADGVARLLESPLAARDALLRFYSRKVLMSPQARAEPVRPDVLFRVWFQDQ